MFIYTRHRRDFRGGRESGGGREKIGHVGANKKMGEGEGAITIIT